MEERAQQLNSSNEAIKEQMVEWMVNGYQEMAEMNLEIANEAVYAEYDAENTTENFLK